MKAGRNLPQPVLAQWLSYVVHVCRLCIPCLPDVHAMSAGCAYHVPTPKTKTKKRPKQFYLCRTQPIICNRCASPNTCLPHMHTMPTKPCHTCAGSNQCSPNTCLPRMHTMPTTSYRTYAGASQARVSQGATGSRRVRLFFDAAMQNCSLSCPILIIKGFVLPPRVFNCHFHPQQSSHLHPPPPFVGGFVRPAECFLYV